MSQQPLTAPPPLVPRVGYDVLLVGDMRLTEPLARAMMQVSDDEHDEEETLPQDHDHAPLPAAVAMLQRRLPVKNSLMRRRNIHLRETLECSDSTAASGTTTTSSKGIVMDHVVLLATYSASNPTWRRDIWKHNAVLLNNLPRMDILQNKMTLVAVPTWDNSHVKHEYNHKQPMSTTTSRSASNHDGLQAHIPIFVCEMQRPESRTTVANMLWNRICSQSGPCSPLVTLPSR